MANYEALAENLQGRGRVGCSTTLPVIECGASIGRMSDEVETISNKLAVA
jgi:hypothetical protein